MSRSSRSCSVASSVSRRLEASFRLLHRRLCGPELGHDLAELGREDALLLLRSRDLRLELGDALVDLGLLRLRILAGGRCGEDERERQPEDDRNVVACSRGSLARRTSLPVGRLAGPFRGLARATAARLAASRRSGPTSAR